MFQSISLIVHRELMWDPTALDDFQKENKKHLYGQECPNSKTFNIIDKMLLCNTRTDIKINVKSQSLLHKYGDKLLTNKQTNKLSNTKDDSPASPNETDRLSNRQPDNQTDIYIQSDKHSRSLIRQKDLVFANI